MSGPRSIGARVFGRARDYARLVRLEHTLFALPFSLGAMVLAARGMPRPATVGLVLVALVCGRTLAMAANRLIDRRIDAANPRTRMRELPSGRVRPAEAYALMAVASVGLVVAVWHLPAICLALLPAAVAIVVGYSYTKFITWLSHGVLGLALATPVVGSQLAVTGAFDVRSCVLALAVVTWVAGFDILYACQDAEFDRGVGLHSVPSRFGVGAALRIAPALHLATPFLLGAYGALLGLPGLYLVGCGVILAILVWEHTICRGGDLTRIERAFFDANVAVSVAFLATCVLAVLKEPVGEVSPSRGRPSLPGPLGPC